ncbi:4-(cytidine 5'-diphospho)-2-C-methyl-D-erythritol kinase [Lacisediminimonas profundi]|uniref:4-(cytidine 5'-diphospho)-2-C-methyl-D-erythritol kinase n=1 Tax=Lacisediminimonas profundi TaxID=2603856 RepID=UPI00124B2747|nr:4-(cytidine 5'-diphospho)-2-C-methyl-D-erythritol kinase [Lacisediminimonas profundi]
MSHEPGRPLSHTSSRTLTGCLAPAKLNLFLHVVGRRADGFHLLQTVFQLLDFGDSLDFSVREDGRIHRITGLAGVPEDADLVIRAARLLQETSGSPLGADISLHKRLPMGGGLGGGSSDAATTLIALNHLWQTGLSRSQLMQLGLRLGADVPFFIFGQNAFAEGVGELLSPVDTPEAWFVVVEPGVPVSTPIIFRSQELTRDTEMVTIADFSRAPTSFGRNDLQAVVTGMFAPVAEALEALGRFGEARMTGSGSCVFCAFETEGAADQAVAALSGAWRAWKARGMNRHPMSQLLES